MMQVKMLKGQKIEHLQADVVAVGEFVGGDEGKDIVFGFIKQVQNGVYKYWFYQNT